MVETYKEQVRSRPVNQQNFNVNASPEAFGAAYGRGLGQLAAGINDFGKAQAIKAEVNAGDEARAAEQRFIERTRQLRYNPETGYLNQTGGNALNRRAGFEDELAKARDEEARNLSPQARKIYEKSTDSLSNGVREQFIRHDAEQSRSYTNEVTAANAEMYVDEALLNYNNPELFEKNLNTALDEVARYNALNGVSVAGAQKARETLLSSVYSGVVMRMADEGVGGATKAQEFMNENMDRFNATDKAQLQKALKPLVLQDRARTWTNDKAGATPRPSESYGSDLSSTDFTARQNAITGLLSDPYAVETRRRESSGGKLDAAPSDGNGGYLSTARGPYQFIEGTWLAMVDRARANGGATWAEGLSREEILEYRWTGGTMAGRDGDVQVANDEMFITFRQYNKEVLNRAGFEASPENEYLLHIFGEGGGVNVLRASPGAMMESIIGLKAAQANNLVGKTAGQYIRSVASSYGAPGAAGGGAQYDWAKLYADALILMETDPELGAAAIAELNQRKSASDASELYGQQAAFDEMYKRGVESGNWDLPTSEALKLGASLSEAFRTAGTNHMQGIQYTDPVVFTSLQDMAITDPDNFKNLELADFLASNELNDSDYRALKTVQDELYNLTNPTPEMQSLKVREAMGGIDPQKLWTDSKEVYELMTGVDPNKATEKRTKEEREQEARFRRALEMAVIEETQRKGGELTPLEMRALSYNLLEPVQVETEGAFGTSMTTVPRYDANHRTKPGGLTQALPVSFEEIPNDVRTALGRALGDEMGGEQRRAEVEKTFNNLIAVAEGRLPEVSLDDVPPELFVSISEETGDVLNPFQFPWGNEKEPGNFLIEDANGNMQEVSEGGLLNIVAVIRRDQLLKIMADAKLSPADVLKGRPARVSTP